MKIKNPLLPVAFTIAGLHLQAQATTAKADSSRLTISGYADAYYGYFTDSLGANALQQYTTVSACDRRFGLNVAQIGAHYTSDKIRGNITIHYGDIAQATWSATFNPVQEANLGFRVANDVWFDAGFFRTHIGTESFLPKNNFLSSTAVATYNEPFYQAGARLSYEGSEKFHAELWVTNGYNFFLDVNSAKSLGVLLNYNFSDNTSLTYTNLFGRESVDGADQTQFRTYHNIYLNTGFGERVLLIVGGDFGTQSNSEIEDSSQTAFMYNALTTLRYRFTKNFSATARFEIYQDPEGFISGTFANEQGNQQGLQMQGYTFGLEFRPVENAYLRPEVRYIQADDKLTIFNNDFNRTTRWEVMVTIGFYFDQIVNLHL